MSLEDYLIESFELLISRKATIAVGKGIVVVLFDSLCLSYYVDDRVVRVQRGVDHLDLSSLLISLVALHSVKFDENED